MATLNQKTAALLVARLNADFIVQEEMPQQETLVLQCAEMVLESVLNFVMMATTESSHASNTV